MGRHLRILLLLLILALPAAAQPTTWSGAWSATAGDHARAFEGTWDATVGDDPDTAAGNWALRDQAGAVLASGSWAARKDGKIWKGGWQARLASGQLYAGTWRAQSALRSPSHFSELFAFALTHVASGTWHMGAAHAGGWSIRAYSRP